MPWNPSLIDIFRDYFTTDYIAAGILIAIIALVASFSFFVFSKNHSIKNSSLFSAMAISSSLWVFVFASLAFCVALFPLYVQSGDGTIITVVKLSLLPTVAMGPVIFYLLRKRALKQIYPFFSVPLKSVTSELESPKNRVTPIFSEVLWKSKLLGVNLSIVPTESGLTASAALDWRGEKVVAISKSAVDALDDEELRSVLAHELGHLVHKDSLRKTLATAYKTA
ncbi:MAG: M48 family metalloprotease, partial [Thaumarchaeota archaeon]|nr:M48 family metalloprotease [Nitrososphaerota archaeon]